MDQRGHTFLAGMRGPPWVWAGADAALCLPAVTSQWWCTKSWFCWWRSWVAATLSWPDSQGNPFESTPGRAAAAVCVYPVFPCQGIYATMFLILFFCTDCSFAQTVPVCSCIQAAAVLAEDWSTSICNPEDGALYLLYSIMDQWKLWSVGCKKILHFWKMHTHNIKSKACCGFPLAGNHWCSDLD